jgi:hypothetical protein
MEDIKSAKRRGTMTKTLSAPASTRTPSARKSKAVTAESTVTSATVEEVVDADTWVNRRASAQATRAANARQTSGRRRFVDPTTCERDYSMAEMEFMQAMHDYKKSSGRMFPTWSEVLEVIKALGYEKGHESSAAVVQAEARAGHTA